MRALLLSVSLMFAAGAAWAGPACTFIADAKSGEVIYQEGGCASRESPASTFKIALSLMGFDSGILVDAKTPAWPYKDEYRAMMESWKVTTDPTIWIEDSVVWYSQVLTKTMGLEKFRAYMESFGYGNGDISGDPGKDNGLTNAWLNSSLQISPVEEVVFIRRMLAGQLPVSKKALEATIAIMPAFPAADDWTLHGKTGTGVLRGADGKLDRNRQFGWFVGWAEKGERTVVFARLIRDDEKTDDRAGVRVRGQFIDELPKILSAR